MRALIIALAISCPVAAETAEPEPHFDLRQESKDGATMIAVLNRATGAFAIASGEGDLDLLDGEAATKAFKTTFAGESSDQGTPNLGGKAAPGRRSRGIVVHKMDYEEDSRDPLAENEARVVKRRARDYEDADKFLGGASSGPDGEQLLSDDDARREVRIFGADRRETAKFIDAADGLDADEKAAMKAAVGLAD
jgi:hypothetical protein